MGTPVHELRCEATADSKALLFPRLQNPLFHIRYQSLHPQAFGLGMQRRALFDALYSELLGRMHRENHSTSFAGARRIELLTGAEVQHVQQSYTASGLPQTWLIARRLVDRHESAQSSAPSYHMHDQSTPPSSLQQHHDSNRQLPSDMNHYEPGTPRPMTSIRYDHSARAFAQVRDMGYGSHVRFHDD